MRRWTELEDEFAKRDIRVVTVSTDRPETIRQRRGAHGLDARMLSDRDLVVTDAFGLRNQLLHSGNPRDSEVEALPVPTTLLVDPGGRVLWIDQSENYQKRSGPQVVLAAVQRYLD